MEYKALSARYDQDLAVLIRRILKKHALDIPGTAYFDESLDHLSAYYDRPGRAYYVLDREGKAAGGAGFAECPFFPEACELQKLYLEESLQGRGLGRALLGLAEREALRLGYRRMYLETHSNLQAAIGLYLAEGFMEIPRPESVVHSTMDRFFLKDLEGAASLQEGSQEKARGSIQAGSLREEA